VKVYCSITLPIRLPLLNEQLRTHWAKRKKQREELAWLFRAELSAAGISIPKRFISKANIRVIRYSRIKPDQIDNLNACVKGLMDILQPMSSRHPNGLGIIANDSSDCVTVTVNHCGSKACRTDVIIEDLS
jgi:hypothetical protein